LYFAFLPPFDFNLAARVDGDTFDYSVELGIDRLRVALSNVTRYILYGFGDLIQLAQSQARPGS